MTDTAGTAIAPGQLMTSVEEDLELLIAAFWNTADRMGYARQARDLFNATPYGVRLFAEAGSRMARFDEDEWKMLAAPVPLPDGNRSIGTSEVRAFRQILAERLNQVRPVLMPTGVEYIDPPALLNRWMGEQRPDRLVLPAAVPEIAEAVDVQRGAFTREILRVGLAQGHCEELEAAIETAGLGAWLPSRKRTVTVVWLGWTVTVDALADRRGVLSNEAALGYVRREMDRLMGDALTAGVLSLSIADRVGDGDTEDSNTEDDD